MSTYIALLRGINVGGKTVLPMKELVPVFEASGFRDVKTYIQSGNVVFRSDRKVTSRDADNIGREILGRKGFEPRVVIIGADELGRAIENNPFPTDEGKSLHFFFLEGRSGHPDLAKLEALKTATEEFLFTDKVLYLYAPDGIGRSKLAAAVEKGVAVPVTARNWNTVRKLADMAEAL